MIYRNRGQSRSYKEMDTHMIAKSAFIKRGKLVGQTVTIKEDIGNDKFIVTDGTKDYICHRSMFIMYKGNVKIKGQ